MDCFSFQLLNTVILADYSHIPGYGNQAYIKIVIKFSICNIYRHRHAIIMADMIHNDTTFFSLNFDLNVLVKLIENFGFS